MKKIFFIITLLVANSVFAQNSTICGEIDYIQSTHFSKDFSRDFTLKFNNQNSIYSEANLNKTKEKIDQSDNDDGRKLSREISRSNLTPEFYYNDRSEFHFMEVWFDEELLVKEDSFQWIWTLKDEQKKIGGFTCQKASIEFRGRTYIAWFTKEIPVPYGPWKFNGLSGLILEVYDTDRVFHIVAKKVKIEKNPVCKITVDKSKFKSSLTIDQYRKRKVELIKEDLAKLSARLPKGYGPLKYDENCDDCREDVELFPKKAK
ncbi:GLPGLI family protein [Tenacibaculum sp. 190524A05c]|uniref:GLPGLI family protein n=1 Tax=Tenacibaculum platacis TaxID=3137852 RepID=A0ABM9NVT0_9FLAO